MSVRLYLLLALCLLITHMAYADDVQVIALSLKDHAFSPKELHVPAGQKIKLVVSNDDPTPAEFESSDLNREKVIAANSKINVFLDALDPGSYGFYDDFRKDTVTGTLIAQ